MNTRDFGSNGPGLVQQPLSPADSSGSLVSLAVELSIAVELYQQQKPRASRAWIRGYLLDPPPPAVLSHQLAALPEELQEMAALILRSSGRQPLAKSPPDKPAVPPWFTWGMVVAGLVSLLAQLAFVIMKLK